MILQILERIVSIGTNFIILMIFLDIILSYLLNPYHQIRQTLDKITQPLLSPIRKFVPPIANIDFTPVILIVLLQIISFLFLKVISSL